MQQAQSIKPFINFNIKVSLAWLICSTVAFINQLRSQQEMATKNLNSSIANELMIALLLGMNGLISVLLKEDEEE